MAQIELLPEWMAAIAEQARQGNAPSGTHRLIELAVAQRKVIEQCSGYLAVHGWHSPLQDFADELWRDEK